MTKYTYLELCKIIRHWPEENNEEWDFILSCYEIFGLDKENKKGESKQDGIKKASEMNTGTKYVEADDDEFWDENAEPSRYNNPPRQNKSEQPRYSFSEISKNLEELTNDFRKLSKTPLYEPIKTSSESEANNTEANISYTLSICILVGFACGMMMFKSCILDKKIPKSNLEYLTEPQTPKQIYIKDDD